MHRKRINAKPPFQKYIKQIAAFVLVIMMTFQSNLTMLSGLAGMEYSTNAYAASAAPKITLNKKTLSINEGESATLKATITPAKTNNTKVKWSSSNKEVAVVSSKGKIKALSAGTTKIIR